MCSNPACHWAYHRRFIHVGCRHSLVGRSKRCGGTLVDPTEIAAITAETAADTQSPPRSLSSTATPPPIQASCTLTPLRTIDEAELGRIGVRASAALGLEGKYLRLENSIVSAILEEALTTPVSTIAHIPRSVRPLLATVLAIELRHAHSGNIWGFVRLQFFAKAVLRSPPQGGRKRRYVIQSLISNRLHRWQEENGIIALWDEARLEPHRKTQKDGGSEALNNAHRALRWAREGRYSDALRSLGSHDVAPSSDTTALLELQNRHHQCLPPAFDEDIPTPMTVDSEQVLSALRSFPQGSSPGGSRLCMQHHLDAICGTTVPAGQQCLLELTRWMNLLLLGQTHRSLSSWLGGASLTALRKKDNSVCPIAVAEVYRRLASRLCCAAVRSELPDLFLPYGQVGVGVKGGLEAAIHALRFHIKEHG